MPATQTPRVKYTLDAAGTIGVQHENWDRADYTAGLIYRLSTDPAIDESTLYDGAVVVEKDTGISTRYLWNGTTFDKRYVNYPMVYRASYQGTQGNGSPSSFGWPTVNNANNTNAPSATWQDPTTKGIKVQVKGLYELKIRSLWAIATVPSVAATDRDLGWFKNGVGQTNFNINKLANTGWTSPTIPHTLIARQLFVVNDLITGYFYNNGGGSSTLNFNVELSLIRPVW